MLPLSIAGEKPDEEWFERADRQGRPRRPAHAPPVRALGRPAAARRDRPRARLAADGGLRRRADRQPRLDDERRDPRAAARRRSTSYGQTTVMVTHDARAAAIADRDPLPRRRPDRQASSAARRSDEILDDDGGDRRRRDPRRAQGPARRASSAPSLTALAIVLGVAMVSGTYVLTDTIDKAFDAIFTERRTRAPTPSITGKAAFDLTDGSGATAPAFDESLLAEGARRCRTSPQADGGVDGDGDS